MVAFWSSYYNRVIIGKRVKPVSISGRRVGKVLAMGLSRSG